jgi:hypothetical protein
MAHSAALRKVGRAILAGSLAAPLVGCTQEPREVPPTDCSVEAKYEFYPLFLPAPEGKHEIDNWYAAGDLNALRVKTDEAGATTPIKAVGDSKAKANWAEYRGDPICGHTVGKQFTFELNHDWGAVGGRWEAMPTADQDASAYEGFSFWALSLYDRSIELNWSDITSANPPENADPSTWTCVPENVTSGTGAKSPNPDFVDENGVPVANGCGSLFSRRVVMSKGWTFYTFPFTDFIQIIRDPRFNPEGLDSSQLRLFSFRVPKDAFVDVSFVNFAWYRKATN